MSSPSSRDILLLGATGQVGHELTQALAPLGTVETPGREEVDLTDLDALRRAVRAADPDVVVNAAAYTDVDGAEEEPDRAATVNRDAARVLAETTNALDSWLVHYSTDYVFDGAGTTPYREEDATNPLNVYGRTKRDGEVAIQDRGGAYLILRTSWVYSDRRSNFFRTMRRLAQENDRLTVVDDQFGSPTWAGWIAEATAAILEQLGHPTRASDQSGLYHLAAGGQTSWYGFARAIFARFGHEEVAVDPVTSDEYPTTAERPAYSVLSSQRAAATFGLEIPTWSVQLADLQRRMEGEQEEGVS